MRDIELCGSQMQAKGKEILYSKSSMEEIFVITVLVLIPMVAVHASSLMLWESC